jgi:hypothetical protein
MPQLEEERKRNGGEPQREIGREDMDINKIILTFFYRIENMIMWTGFCYQKMDLLTQ